jgi:hypothetical protein
MVRWIGRAYRIWTRGASKTAIARARGRQTGPASVGGGTHTPFALRLETAPSLFVHADRFCRFSLRPRVDKPALADRP